MRWLAGTLAGFALWSVLYVGGNALLAILLPGQFAAGVAIGAGTLVVLLALTVVYSALSGVLASRIGRPDGARSALALGALLLLVGAAVQWQYRHVLPLWYHVAFLGLLVPSSWLGHALAGRSRSGRSD